MLFEATVLQNKVPVVMQTQAQNATVALQYFSNFGRVVSGPNFK
jgi:hypothetical protein|tara:strand:- start:671 stop:802 length:132 start_codon:yes stop_codon:yes gene_type:complete